MNNAYTFVDDVASLPEKVNSLENVIKAIVQQTFECALFIREYCGRGFASMFQNSVGLLILRDLTKKVQ